VVVFLSTRCPCSAGYVDRLARLERAFALKSVRIVGIDSNANEPAEDVARFAKSQGLPFPLLKDRDGSVLRAFGATHTPEAFVLGADRVVRYAGGIDDSLEEARVRRCFLADALAALTAGKSPAVSISKAVGCGILALTPNPSPKNRGGGTGDQVVR
jgi:hypothetical protein